MVRLTAIAALVAAGGAHAAPLDVLLIPDSNEDKVWAFSPVDGSLVDDNFIPDDGRLVTPINAIKSPRGTIFISDQGTDEVYEYGTDGNYIRTLVRESEGLDIRGIAVNNNRLYVTDGSGDTVWSFSLKGRDKQPWANLSMGSPWDVTFLSNGEALVSNSSTENVERFDASGNHLGTFVDGDGVTSIDFPQQIHELDNGNVIVGGFSVPSGAYIYDSSGTELDVIFDGFGPRGAYELDNGDFIASTGILVRGYDPDTDTVSTIVETGTGSVEYPDFSNFRFIERVPAPGAATLLGLAGLAALRRRR
ncbi:MAG: hypothetical protein AAFX05_09190 [Planctomycetota bacterium]